MRPSSRAPVAAQIIGLITLLPYAASLKLPRCTVAVAGANGRVGSAVCRTLLREHPQVTVRALVRSAKDPYKGYGRLSYEVGAEDGNMDLKAAWAMDDETGRFASPQTMEFDADVQGGYGLDRLEIRECELRYSKDVDEALSDVDAVIWCASAFNSQRQRIPDRLDDAARAIDQRGMALFELRLGKALFGEEEKADGTDPARREAAAGKTADEDGLSLACKTLGSTRRRRATLAELTGGQAADSQRGGIVTPLVVLSASAALGYDEDKWGGPPQENEFGFRKRNGEATVSGSGLPHVIVRSAAIDEVQGEEGLEVQTLEAPDAEAQAKIAEAGEEGVVGVADREAKKRRIHPRDLARFLVGCLEPLNAGTGSGATGSAEGGRVVEAWTYTKK